MRTVENRCEIKTRYSVTGQLREAQEDSIFRPCIETA